MNKRTILEVNLSTLKNNYQNILDVGCGYGLVGRDRFSCFRNKVIIGIDISDTVLSKARELNRSNNVYYERLDVTSKSFDKEIRMIITIRISTCRFFH